MELKSIAEVSDLRGKVVLVRASCNVPLVEGKVRNSFRLRRALPTLKYLKEAGAKVIVISHIGRELDETLLPVFEELAVSIKMQWGGKVTDPLFTEKKAALNDGDILFCENLRQDVSEEENDDSLGALLAEGVDLYVNDAFAEAHREHASTYGVAKLLPAYAGLTLIEEVTELQKVMQPNHPSLFLLGGAKFETKMPLVEKYLALYDHVFVGGALANDVLKARGFEVGTSLVSEVSLNDAPFLWSEKMLVPVDVIVEGPRGVVTKPADQVLPDEKIFDMGPETVELLTRYIAEAKTIDRKSVV